MRQPPKTPPNAEPGSPLEMLSALGFGPDTVLMNDPKLFVDGRFLASLLVELNDELGEQDAALALFQIGLLHGLRDAARVTRAHEVPESTAQRPGSTADTTPLVMRWEAGARANADGDLSVTGSWPERHEAVSRCARLGAASAPACSMSAGYTSGWLSGTLDAALIVKEVECAATGAERCRFEAREARDWISSGDSVIESIISNVPFEAFRKVAASPEVERGAAPPDAEFNAGDGRFDRNQSVVHIWGPVMVLPFTTLDEALGTVDMLGRDPGIREIRAVVVDLREQPIDDGFGAAALEQVLETVESWNAQSLITGVCPASEATLADLEASHLVLRKDLPEAIATAFQVADAQKHLV